jgi:hypothetical protein
MGSLYSVSLRILFVFLFVFIHVPERALPMQDKADSRDVFKSYFESKGFNTGKISIPELKLEVLLEENQFYKREDSVADINVRINEIREEFGLSTPYRDYHHGYGWSGVFEANIEQEKAYVYIVLISENLNRASMIYTKAHENGHFLWYIGKQGIVYQKFKKADYVKSKIQTNEDFGNLCGWMALKIAGYNLDECFILNRENPKQEIKLISLRNLVRHYLLY